MELGISYTAPTSCGWSPSGGGIIKGGLVVAVAALVGDFFYKNTRRPFIYNNYNNGTYPDGQDPYKDQDQSYHN
ncbi:hypothetical protein BGZ98_004000 [Dissophora globulifera]|nr:hypothetical protein BGZ98_004000 [Dissophora globulifera]